MTGSNCATKRVLMSWSSGKDSAWALHRLHTMPGIEVVGLLTSFNETADRVAMHAVRRLLVEEQALALGLPLVTVALPWPCSNADYERRMRTALAEARARGVTHVAFGDLFLRDVRTYRERMLDGTGLAPLFPIWGCETRMLAREMVASGLRAILTCVDPRMLDARFIGRDFDDTLLDELPADVDPCGEKGEFHTFAHAGPMFHRPIPVCRGQRVVRDGFQYLDLLAAATVSAAPSPTTGSA